MKALSSKGIEMLEAFGLQLPKSLLEEEYLVNLLSERQLAAKYKIPRQWIRLLKEKYGVPHLTKSDRAEIRSPNEFTQEQKDLVLGALLGDGGVYERERKDGGGPCYFKIGHKVECRLLVEHYASVLQNFNPRFYTDRQKKNGRIYTQVGITTHSSMLWRPYRELFYPNGVKVWKPQILEMLTPRALAYWYTGDGAYCVDGEYGDIVLVSELLAGKLEDRKAFVAWAEQFGLRFREAVYPSSEEKLAHFRLYREDQEIFTRLIAPLIPDGALYKIPPEFRDILTLDESLEELNRLWLRGYSPEVVEETFNLYRKRGFPYPVRNYREQCSEVSRIKNMETHKIVREGKFQHHRCGVALLNSYFPNIWEIRVRGQKTLKEQFDDDTILRKVIKDRFKYGRGLYPAQLLVGLRMRSKPPANYPPATAKCLYDVLMPEEGGKSLDPSSGFGGRLLGAICSSKVKQHVALEPAEETYRRSLGLLKDWDNGKVTLLRNTAEGWCPKTHHGTFDLVFTSPPYFDQEEYSVEDTQVWRSCKTLEDYRVWIQKVVSNAWSLLKVGGKLAIQVSNPTKSHKRIPIVPFWKEEIISKFGEHIEWEYDSPGGRGSRVKEVLLIGKKFISEVL